MYTSSSAAAANADAAADAAAGGAVVLRTAAAPHAAAPPSRWSPQKGVRGAAAAAEDEEEEEEGEGGGYEDVQTAPWGGEEPAPTPAPFASRTSSLPNRSPPESRLQLLDMSPSSAVASTSAQDLAAALKAVRRLTSDLAAAEARAEACEGAALCVVCLDEPRGTLLCPCMHVCVCPRCAGPLGSCPMCAQGVGEWMRVYLS